MLQHPRYKTIKYWAFSFIIEKNVKLLYKENDNEVSNLVSDTIMKEDLMGKEECPHICESFFKLNIYE